MSPLAVVLASLLPSPLKIKIYHIETTSTASSALFSPLPGASEEPTQCIKHLLSVTVPAGDDGKDEVIAFALEIFIYTSANLTTIFVSKADSTGFLTLLKAPSGTPSIIRTISTGFLQYLIDQEPKEKRVVLSLFARAQNQYLFPGSIDVPTKHVLDDRQLIKWWCRTVDPILRAFKNEENGDSTTASDTVTASAYVVVPGCDKYETRSFFPPSAHTDQPSQPRWHATHPLYLLASVEDPKSAPPPRCIVPRFPDDPKSRFLDDLDDEIRLPDSLEVGNEGRWRSVKTLEQFWEMMSYRQECSAGRLVGFVWVVLSKGDATVATEVSTSNGQKSDPDAPPLPASEDSIKPSDLTSTDTKVELGLNPASTEPGSELSTNINSLPPATPASSPLLISSESYDALMSNLITLDFSTLPLAIESTSSFLRFASTKAGLPANTPWIGEELTGTLTLPALASTNGSATTAGKQSSTTLTSTEGGVNVLTGLARKKRKATLSAPSADDTTAPDTQLESSTTGTEAETSSSTNPTTSIPIVEVQAQAQPPTQTEEPGVRTLSAGLIRKKKKI